MASLSLSLSLSLFLCIQGKAIDGLRKEHNVFYNKHNIEDVHMY